MPHAQGKGNLPFKESTIPGIMMPTLFLGIGTPNKRAKVAAMST